MPYWGLTLTRVISGNNLAAIYYNNRFSEYVVRFCTNGIHNVSADYFTDSKEDAVGTAEHQIKFRPPALAGVSPSTVVTTQVVCLSVSR